LYIEFCGTAVRVGFYASRGEMMAAEPAYARFLTEFASEGTPEITHNGPPVSPVLDALERGDPQTVR
jgi:hypothetical protein